MKFAKSILMGTGAVVLAGLILALLVPKAAHAVAATAVQVMNTSANPVPVQNVPGKPFVQSCDVFFRGDCNLSPPVPAGFTFVVQHSNVRTAELSGTTTSMGSFYWVFYTQGQFVSESQAAPMVERSLGAKYSIGDYQVTWYIDALTTPYVAASQVNELNATLIGYLIPQ